MCTVNLSRPKIKLAKLATVNTVLDSLHGESLVKLQCYSFIGALFLLNFLHYNYKLHSCNAIKGLLSN